MFGGIEILSIFVGKKCTQKSAYIMAFIAAVSVATSVIVKFLGRIGDIAGTLYSQASSNSVETSAASFYSDSGDICLILLQFVVFYDAYRLYLSLKL